MSSRIAGLMPIGRGVYPYLGAAILSLRNLCDTLIILNDNMSISSVEVDEVVTVANCERWHDSGNRLTLLARAAAHNCRWCVFLDSDEVFEPNFNKDALRSTIHDAEQIGAELIDFQMCEVWQTDPVKYRIDGIWGQKRKPRVQRNPFMGEVVHWRGNHLQRLHAIPLQVGDVHAVDWRILHYGMSSPELRGARVEKYKRIDPQNVFQPQGYDYMLDETGIVLKEL